jgi:hypothetical protein
MTGNASTARLPADSDGGIDEVSRELVEMFGSAMDVDIIVRVALSARRDLEGEVAPAALAEFAHRLARQRRDDLCNKS